MIQFQLTNEFIDQVEQLIATNNGEQLEFLLKELHFADIAELLQNYWIARLPVKF